VNTYPPPPWRLEGWGVATFGLLDSAAAKGFVPAGARLVTIVPGKTVGGLLFLSYERGSLVYRELNVVAGLARVGMRFAYLLARLYVDSSASLAGGREIWGVPKELATFGVGQSDGLTTIDVLNGTQRICRLRCTAPGPGLRLPIPLPSFGLRDDAFLFFTGTLLARTSLIRASVEMPVEGPFAGLGLSRPLIALRCDNATIAVPAPRVISRPFGLRAAVAEPARFRERVPADQTR
jgi:hypothetical protein